MLHIAVKFSKQLNLHGDRGTKCVLHLTMMLTNSYTIQTCISLLDLSLAYVNFDCTVQNHAYGFIVMMISAVKIHHNRTD